MANGLGDYYSSTVANANNKAKNQRKLSDMYSDKNGNRVEKYSDGSTITYDKKGNIISDSSVKNNNISVNPIKNASKAGNQYDYMADVSKDKDRAREMIGNLKQYANTNPQLFKNYENFKKFFNYDGRSASQQYVLDAAYKNYNKYGLNSTENSVADDASQLASDKGKEKVQIAIDGYNKRAANLKTIYDTLNPKYQNLINKYDQLYEKAFKELDELKKLANEYYQHTKGMYDEQSAGEAAGVESRLSAQGLGYTAIGSSTTGVGNQWAKRYNNLMATHLDNLMKLQDKGATIQTTILNGMGDLTDKQAGIVKDYFTGLNGLWDAVEKEQQNAVDGVYKPYEEITGQKVTSTAEVAGTGAKLEAKNSQYQSMNDVEKRNMIINNLITIYGEGVDLSEKGPYFNAIAQAVADNPNDWERALYQAVNKLKAAGVKPKSKGDGEDTEDVYKTLEDMFNNSKSSLSWKAVHKANPNIKEEDYWYYIAFLDNNKSK